jgi:hypothetical protein
MNPRAKIVGIKRRPIVDFRAGRASFNQTAKQEAGRQKKELFMTATSPATKHLTKEEVDQARLFLQQTQNSVLGSTRALTKTQWNFKPAPDKWSVAETLDHIVTVQERVLGMLASLSSAPTAPADRDTTAIDAIIIYRFPARLTKFSAPEFIQPTGQILPAELLDRFKKNCVRFSDALESVPELREHVLEAPPLKAVSSGQYNEMDGYQWILAAAAHNERHAKQMLEVMASCEFPQ